MFRIASKFTQIAGGVRHSSTVAQKPLSLFNIYCVIKIGLVLGGCSGGIIHGATAKNPTLYIKHESTGYEVTCSMNRVQNACLWGTIGAVGGIFAEFIILSELIKAATAK